MCPTIFRYKKYRFFFFSHEEDRMHVHIASVDGGAKFWLEPMVALADYNGLSKRELNELEKITKTYANEIKKAWKEYFNR